MTKIKVLIVDDHALVRDGIRALLDLVADFEVIGEAANGKEALEKIKDLSPDVALMDLAMPVMTGLEATRKIRKEFPRTKVIAVTQHDDTEYVVPVIRAGARGFVTKMAASSEIISAIRAVHKGDSFLSSSAAAALIHDFQVGAARENEADLYDQLTEREKEVFKLLVEGKTTREIASVMVIGLKSVEAYKTSLRNKLNIHNQTDLIKYAIRKHVTTL
ncbi:MAG: response regulator transcription factor [Chloroflexi bacterium]|nr:response regulator transcription factor [Chloroflexota bacterium]